MFDDFLKLVSRLREKNESFAVATVVRCERPTSAKPGDRALISRDGKLSGWVGGGCAQPIVIKEAIRALQDGNTRLLRVSPTAGAEPSNGVTGYTMMCHSGGTLDIFIEPVLSKSRLLIFGRSHVAQTLAKIGKILSYHVVVVAPEESRKDFAVVDVFHKSDRGEDLAGMIDDMKSSTRSAIVVSTQGEEDEEALEQALRIDAAYIAFVASKKKWEVVTEYLRKKGYSASRLNHVKVPAGLDINASSPEEIAISIFAEMIQVLKTTAQESNEPVKHQSTGALEQKDPICGMMVNVATAKHISQVNGTTFYFCCAHCKATFDKNPKEYLQREEHG